MACKHNRSLTFILFRSALGYSQLTWRTSYCPESTDSTAYQVTTPHDSRVLGGYFEQVDNSTKSEQRPQ